MTTILLHVQADDGQEARLQSALDLARAFEGHLICAQVTPFDSFVAGDPFGGIYAFTDVLESVREQEVAERERIEAQLAREGVSWTWLQVDGNPATLLIDQSKLADFVILSRSVADPHSVSRHALALAGDIALHARAPIVAVSPHCRGFDVADAAAIAWNGSFEAANALKAALPLLKLASKVHLIELVQDADRFPATDAAAYLSRHGISAEIHQRALGTEDVASALCGAVQLLRARYLVMGAYGHSRLREAVLGGATRHMLESSPVPLVMTH